MFWDTNFITRAVGNPLVFRVCLGLTITYDFCLWITLMRICTFRASFFTFLATNLSNISVNPLSIIDGLIDTAEDCWSQKSQDKYRIQHGEAIT